MPGAAMACADNAAAAAADGNVAVAHALLEEMQESGARDRVKEWLFEALENAGWTAALDREAAAFVVRRATEHTADADTGAQQPPPPAPPSVADIAEHLLAKGFETIPEHIRERLLKETVAAARAFAVPAPQQAQ